MTSHRFYWNKNDFPEPNVGDFIKDYFPENSWRKLPGFHDTTNKQTNKQKKTTKCHTALSVQLTTELSGISL